MMLKAGSWSGLRSGTKARNRPHLPPTLHWRTPWLVPVGPLTPPSNKLKSGCWPTLEAWSAHRARCLLCPLPTNAAFNRRSSPGIPPGFRSTFSDDIANTSNIGDRAQWRLGSALVTSSQADFAASRCLGGKTWCEAGEGLRISWHLGHRHHGAISHDAGERRCPSVARVFNAD